MIIGFVGTGEITKAVVTGLSTLEGDRPSILVSPRNAAIAGALSKRFENVSVAESNQDVVDRADLVCLALRPADADGIVSGLRFRPEQRVLSFMATFGHARVEKMVAPAARVTLVTPLPAVAFHGGPTPIFPPDETVVSLFEPLGTAVAVETEDEYQALCVSTATLAGAFAYYGTIADWLAAKNVPADKARAFSGAIFHALAATAKNAPQRSFAQITAESATRGGTNEQLLAQLKDGDVYGVLSKAMDGIWQRFEDAKS